MFSNTEKTAPTDPELFKLWLTEQWPPSRIMKILRSFLRTSPENLADLSSDIWLDCFIKQRYPSLLLIKNKARDWIQKDQTARKHLDPVSRLRLLTTGLENIQLLVSDLIDLSHLTSTERNVVYEKFWLGEQLSRTKQRRLNDALDKLKLTSEQI